jgi:hypothetical protein
MSRSDRRLERLAKLEHILTSSKRDRDYDDISYLTHEMINVISTERLTGKVAEYYQKFMILCYQHGDFSSALEFGKTALQHAEVFSDPGGSFVDEIRQIVEYLERKRRVSK